MTDELRRRSVIQDGAERNLLLMIVSFAIAVIGIRWFLDATGYPQVGGGELHVAHMLWGGLLLVVSVVVLLVFDARWAAPAAAIAAGAGTGLFIDEVGKFITASNDYFYPLAAPLIYGAFLVLVVVFVAIRRRPTGQSGGSMPRTVSRWEEAHLPQRRYRRILVLLLGLLGLGWVLGAVIYVNLDTATIRDVIDSLVRQPGRIERPDDPLFYWLELIVLGTGGVLLVLAAVLLGRGSDGRGTVLAIVGLGIALTAGAILSLYVEQISAISSTVVNALTLLLVMHYRSRFVTSEPTPEREPAGG